MQKARRQSTKDLRPFVGARFQVLFHFPLGELFTFPSRYWFTIGRLVVFSLRRWSSWIPTGFPVSRGTRVSSKLDSTIRLLAYHHLWGGFPTAST